jgi:hypothetical protein
MLVREPMLATTMRGKDLVHRFRLNERDAMGYSSLATSQVSYEDALRDLYRTLGAQYPCFELKGIDWKKVGEELLPRAEKVKTDAEFGLLCMELVARLEDSHAQLQGGRRGPPLHLFPAGTQGSPV